MLGPRLAFEPVAGWIVLTVAAAGVFARLATLGADPMWADELYSWAVTRMSWERVLFVPFDVHPPLYYALLKAVTAFGESEVVLRSLSAACGVLTACVVYAYARKYCGPRAGLVAGAATLLSYRLIVHASTVRNYAMVLLFCVAASWALGEVVERWRARRPRSAVSALYVLLSTLALMTHTVAAIYLAVLSGLFFVVIGASHRGRALSLAVLIALLNAPAFLGLAAWFLGASQTSGDFDWLVPFGVIDALRIYVSNIAPANLPAPIVLICGLCVAAGLGVSLLRTAPAYWIPVLAMLVGLPATLFALSPLKALYMERTILLAAPGAALALAALVAGLRDRRIANAIGVLLVCAYAASSLVYVRRDETEVSHGMQNIQDFRQAVAIVDRQVTGRTAVLTCTAFTEPALRYYGKQADYARLTYLPGAGFSRDGAWEDFYGRPAGSRSADRPAPEALGPFDRILFMRVDMFCPQQGPDGALARDGFVLRGSRSVRGITVQTFERAGPVPRSGRPAPAGLRP